MRKEKIHVQPGDDKVANNLGIGKEVQARHGKYTRKERKLKKKEDAASLTKYIQSDPRLQEYVPTLTQRTEEVVVEENAATNDANQEMSVEATTWKKSGRSAEAKATAKARRQIENADKEALEETRETENAELAEKAEKRFSYHTAIALGERTK